MAHCLTASDSATVVPRSARASLTVVFRAIATIATALLPLVLGVVFYVAWRTEEVRVVTWLPLAVVRALRASIGRIPMPAIVIGIFSAIGFFAKRVPSTTSVPQASR